MSAGLACGAGRVRRSPGWLAIACLSALALLACEREESPAQDAGANGSDSGGVGNAVPTCALDSWQLAAALRLALSVDYLADRDTRGPLTFSERGKACATASVKSACEGALALSALPREFGRHLATTRADEVHFWRGAEAKQLLGAIDAPADAIWLLLNEDRYHVPCSVQLSASGAGGFSVQGITRGNAECPANLTLILVNARVSRDGEVSEISANPIEGRSCPVSGAD